MIAGILLAAGASTRFGSDKLLYQLANGTPIAVAAARTLKQSVDRAIAVVRPQSDVLAQHLRAEGLEIVVCRNASEGMGRSLACGVEAAGEAEAWLIALADMPFVRAETMRAIVDQLARGAVIAAPSFKAQRGHPVGFGRSLYAELVALQGDAGARAVLEQHANEMALFECGDPGILQDADTAEDVGNAASRLV